MLTLNKNNVGTIYCVGRNYALHAKELNNPIPKEPVIFTKTASTLCQLSDKIELPLSLGRVDHELEIVVRIGKDLYQASKEQVEEAISHYGLGLDLTLRHKQTELKENRYPWDLSKSFINACPVTPMLPLKSAKPLNNIEFSMTVLAKDDMTVQQNPTPRQAGNSKDMLFDIVTLIEFLSHKIPLSEGDLVMTGTPEGVGPLHDSDELQLAMDNVISATCTISRS